MDRARHAGRRKRRLGKAKIAAIVLVCAALVGVDLMFFFWPFRYRQVQPLLQQVFRSRVDVEAYHRTYFPHPGFVAEGVTFYRLGDTAIPPLATMRRMQVIGTWTNLFFHPHLLYQIRLQGLYVQIPPSGTKARGMDFNQGVMDSSQSKIRIDTIVADGTILDFLRPNHQAPMRFRFATLRIHNVRQGQPLQFVTRVTIPGPEGTIFANGSLGPLQANAWGATPVSGTYQLENADLSRVDGIAGHAAARGQYNGTLSHLDIAGQATIPDFRAGSAHTVRMDSNYQLTVNGTNGDLTIGRVLVKSGNSVITASGSITGNPKKVALTLGTSDSSVEDLLDIVEESAPQVRGRVSFQAAVEFPYGPGRFLKKLQLNGKITLAGMQFVTAGTQDKMDSFSARVSNPPVNAGDDPPAVSAAARSDTRFDQGMAYFPDILVTLPGAEAHLHGTFDLLDTRIHLTGRIALQRGISHAVTGWKSWILKPLTPFFRHKDAGAVVPIAITGTAKSPRLSQNLLHDK